MREVTRGLFLLLAARACASDPLPHILTVEQAAQVVQQFAGRRPFPVVYRCVDWGNGYYWPNYVFAASTGTETGTTYSVDPWQGRVVYMEAPGAYGGGTDDAGVPELSQMITPDRVFGIACEMMQRQDPGFSPYDYDVRGRPFHGGMIAPGVGYSRPANTIYLQFTRRTPLDVESRFAGCSDAAAMRIDATEGRVLMFKRDCVPPRRPVKALISEREAKEIALGSMKSLAALGGAKHLGHPTEIACAYAFEANPSCVVCSDYPNCRVPVWKVTVIWSEGDADTGRIAVCGGHETGVIVHAMTGEVLSQSRVMGTDIPPVEVDEAYCAYYADLPQRPLPWVVCIGGWTGGTVGYFYPFPETRAGGLYVKHSFAWLMGVRVEVHEKGYLLRGIADVPVPADEVQIKDGSPWFPMDRLAAASRAEITLDTRERYLKVDLDYPVVGWPR